jgi:hypothetical protein
MVNDINKNDINENSQNNINENVSKSSKKKELNLSSINSNHAYDVQFINKSQTEINLNIKKDIRNKLSAHWFANTYTNVKLVNDKWIVPINPPKNFKCPPPPEYLDSFLEPCYWAMSLTNEFWISWREFWNGKIPNWPPPYPPETLKGYYEPKTIFSKNENEIVFTTNVIPEYVIHEPDPCVNLDCEKSKDKKDNQIQNINSGDVRFEELCCVGFNPEDSTLEAIIKIKQETGYGGDLTTNGSLENVGFWITPSTEQIQVPNPNFNSIYIGTTSVSVFDISRKNKSNNLLNPDYYIVQPLYYSVKLQLTPDTIKYIINSNIFLGNISMIGLQLAKIHCVLAWKTKVTSENFNGNGLRSGYRWSILEADIQFPKYSPSFGKNVLRERKVDTSKTYDDPISIKNDREPRTFPIHTVLLKNGKVLMFGGSSNIYYSPFEYETIYNEQKKRYEQVFKKDSNGNFIINAKDVYIINEIISKSVMLYDPVEDILIQASPPPLQKNNSVCNKTKDGDYIPLKYVDIFCSGHSIMPDGSVFVAGGTEFLVQKEPLESVHHNHFPGLWNTCIFNPDSNTWQNGPDMLHGRWYPSTLILGDGNIAMMAGHTNNLDIQTIFINNIERTRHENLDLEILDWKTLKWQKQIPNAMGSLNLSASIYNSDPNIMVKDESPGYYPRLFLLPNGLVFCATYLAHAPLSNNIYDYNHRMTVGPLDDPNKFNYLWNPIKNEWLKLVTNIGGNWSLDTTALMLPILPPYNLKTITIMSLPEKKYYLINPLENNPKWIEKTNRIISETRIFGNTVVLPDGNIMLVGGVKDWVKRDKDDKIIDSGINQNDGVQEVEFYDIKKQNWFVGQSLKKVRNYHSNAILLPDGRVLINGSNPHRYAGDVNNPFYWSEEFKNEKLEYYHELSFELYSPDYLFRGPRPEFTIDKSKITIYNEDAGNKIRLHIKLAESWKIKNIRRDRIGLIRLGSVTHAFNFDQRYVGLKILGDVDIPYIENSNLDLENEEFDVIIPSNPNLLPPGYYMLFLVSALSPDPEDLRFPLMGCPSIAQIIQIELSDANYINTDDNLPGGQ